MSAPVEARALRRLCDGVVFRLCTTWIRESPSSPLYKCMEAARAADELWEKQLRWVSNLTPVEIGIDPRHISSTLFTDTVFSDATNVLKEFVRSSLSGGGSSTVRTCVFQCVHF